jgi:hypothetical protein
MSTRIIYAVIQRRVLSRLSIREKQRLLFTILMNLGMADIAPAAYMIESVTQHADGTVVITGKPRSAQLVI